MKKLTGTILALLTLLCALWATPALALDYMVTGYTTSALLFDATGANIIGDPDAGLNGYYAFHLSGADTSNLSASFAIYDKSVFAGNANKLFGVNLADTFSFSQAGSIFTFGNVTNGDSLQFELAALTAEPGIATADARGVAGTMFYVNQVYLDDLTGLPYSYDMLGNLTDPTTLYGAILKDGFTAADINGNNLDIVIDDAAAVPEPSSLLLVGAGLAAVGFLRRRKTA